MYRLQSMKYHWRNGYLTKQTGDFTIMYSYHDPYSLQERNTQSLLHVLPLKKQIRQKEQKNKKKTCQKKNNKWLMQFLQQGK